MYGDGFSDKELEKIKIMLEKNMTEYKDVTVLVTNKDFKYKQLTDQAWDRLEKSIEYEKS
jgi:hypothetical protein